METVLITGASRGIGLEITKQFLESGYNVISTYRGQPSQELAALQSSSHLVIYELEVTNENSVSKLVENVAGMPIDILINNAGVLGPEKQTLDTIDASGWLETIAVNTISPLLVSRAFIPNLELSTNPRIITISSQMGSLQRESGGMYAYGSSKAAVNKVMQMLSLELKASGITVCPVHPGWVKTDMGGSEADITVQESASGIVALAQSLDIQQTGKFFTWEAKEHDW
ncbi:SDR family oxidoreductase [Marinobacterium jannaschii]|uniref:SDR family oxidoreductase n=1 Tax=Marinobacterium jannaschii TaxID=64970 RepID=UPI000481E7B4|nr:SDR family oxidoreductase [Marinobacterium jannaschii]